MKKCIFLLLVLTLASHSCNVEQNHDEELRNALSGNRWAMEEDNASSLIRGYYFFLDDTTVEWYNSDYGENYYFSAPGVITAREDNFYKMFSNLYRVENNTLYIGGSIGEIDRHLEIIDSYTLRSQASIFFKKIVTFSK